MMVIRRTGVQIDTPLCFSAHQINDARCAACNYETRCIKNTRRVNERLTIRQAADEAILAYNAGHWDENVTSTDLILQIVEAWHKAGGPRTNWGVKPEWHEAMDRVIAICKAGGWNPRTYIKAQLSMVTEFCIKKKFSISLGMLIGKNAILRFQFWAKNNQKRFNNAKRNREIDPEFEALTAAESKFGQLYITSTGHSIIDIEDEVREQSPFWALKLTAAMPHVRLPALSGAASTIFPLAPSHILIPSDGQWSWEEAREVILDVFGSHKREEVESVNIDSSLGTTL